ncbi:MAG TPA: pyridoxamine 5'-phosphate oxidase family protein [Longimicrobiaceae bacterium]
MKSTAIPRFRELTRAEIDALLARNHVGRMAFVRGNDIDIEPIHYVYANGWLYGRTSPGRKVDFTAREWWPIAFEVDEIYDLFHWRSAVVHGGFYTLDPEGAAWEREEAQKAVELLRTLIPETFTDKDPVPFRNILFRIAVQEVSGRAAEPSE